MESTNLHSSSLHLQDHVVETSVIPTSLVFSSINVADNYFLNNNNNNIHATCDEASQNSYNNPMIQDLRFPLPHQNNINISIIQPSFHHDNQHLISNNIIKEESSTSSDQSNSSSFQTFSEMLSPSTTTTPAYKNQMIFQPLPFQQSMQFQNNNDNNNIIDDNINNNNINNNNLPILGGLSRGNNTTFSQIFPSVNISKLSLTSTNNNNNNNNNNNHNNNHNNSKDNYSSEFGNGLDLFSRENLMGGGSHNQASNSNFLELLKGGSHYGVNHDLQPSNDLKLCNHSTNNNHSSFDNDGVVEPKSSRPSCIVEPIKSTHQSPSNKKQRFETRPSGPPFKVRKEKLGDRVAALQQLVAPFGKTDTASVLIEAIGYIKFLHSQVETLSAPYMKLALRNKNSQIHQRISEESHENEVIKQDLRSRGLCLVPLTCMSYIATDFEINGGIWPPHNSYPGFTL